MSSSYGDNFRISIFGESHAAAIGVTIEGLPAGSPIDSGKLQAFLDRRAPGRDAFSTSRREADVPEFLCGVKNDIATGAPITAIIRNSDTRSKDYANLANIPRPGHADYPAEVKFGGCQDRAGGGHFSGRLTAPLCIAGGIALQQIERLGVSVSARAVRIGGETDPNRMKAAIAAARDAGDSVGGVVEAEVRGLPPGIGGPMFGGLENRIAQIVFGIPAVKGIEFGEGFAVADLKGSENNDPYGIVDGKVVPLTNHAGGILGGISTGAPVVLRVAFKPTPSIAKEQDSVDLRKMEPAKLAVKGRHDPCVVLRAIPCVEASVAVAVFDAVLEHRKGQS
ncbi:MAG: chorismate synthase [Kiritimatiellae bacterium]|nr:chorismate synthase [Kiritimatiellia bacterium]